MSRPAEACSVVALMKTHSVRSTLISDAVRCDERSAYRRFLELAEQPVLAALGEFGSGEAVLRRIASAVSVCCRCRRRAAPDLDREPEELEEEELL